MIAATSLPDRTHYAPLGRCRMSTFHAATSQTWHQVG
jgi:hypothetical protein